MRILKVELPGQTPNEYDAPWYNDAAEVGRQFVAGAVVDLPKMLGQGLRRISPDNSVLDNFGRDITESAMAREEGWAPDMAGRGLVAETLIKGSRAIAPMLPVLGAGMVNPLLGGAVAAGQFGLSAAQDTEDKLRLQGVADDQATMAGWKTGAIQGLGEAAAGYLGTKFIRPLLPGSAPTMQSALKSATDTRVLTPFLKGMGINMLAQPATEVAQDLGTEFIERSYGAAPEDAWGIAKDSAQGAVGMTALLGPLAFLGHRSKSRQAQQVADALAPLQDPNADPLSKQMAMATAVQIGQQFKVSPQQINAWLDAQRVAPEDVAAREPAGPRSYPVGMPVNTGVGPVDPNAYVPPAGNQGFWMPPRPEEPVFRPPIMLGMDPSLGRGLTAESQTVPGVINVTSGGTAAPMAALSGQQYDMFGGQDTFGDTGTLPQRPELLNPNAPLESQAVPDGQTRDMLQESPTAMANAGDALVPSAIRSQIMQRLGAKGDGSRPVGKNQPDGLTMRLGLDLYKLLPNAEAANRHLDGVEAGLQKDLEKLDKQVSGGSNKLTPEEYGQKRQVIDNRLLIVEAAREVVADTARNRMNAYRDEAVSRGPQQGTATGMAPWSVGTENTQRQGSVRALTQEADERTDTRRRAAADEDRMAILRGVLGDRTRNNPVARFRRALMEAGYKNLDVTPAEQAEIDRVSQRRDDVRAATVVPPALAAARGRLTPRASLDAAPQQEQETADVSVADAPGPGPGEGGDARGADAGRGVVDPGSDAGAGGQPPAPPPAGGVGADGQAVETQRVGTRRRDAPAVAEAPAPAPVAAPAQPPAAAPAPAAPKKPVRKASDETVAAIEESEVAVREGRVSTAGFIPLGRKVSQLAELDKRIAALQAQGANVRSRTFQDLLAERRTLQASIDRAQESQARTQEKKETAAESKRTWQGVTDEERKLTKGTTRSKQDERAGELRQRLFKIMMAQDAPIQHRERAQRLESMLRDKTLNESVADMVTNNDMAEQELEAMLNSTWRAGPAAESQPATHVSRETLESALDEVRARTPGAPEVVVLDRGSQIGIPDTVMGAVHNGKVHIFLEATPNRLEALKSLWHEFFHVGFANWLGQRPYAQTLIRLAQQDAVVRKYAEEWRRSEEGVGRRKFMSYNDWFARSVEEGMARVAEDLKTNGGTRQMNATVKRIVDWAADVADKLGLKGLGDSLRKMSMTDMERFVNDMINRAGDGKGPDDGRNRGRTQRDANFEKWFGKSKIVNPDGTPKVMYHGTARNITEFRAKQAGAIFVTDDPRFADGFASSSAYYMADKGVYELTPEQRSQAADRAIKKIREEYPDEEFDTVVSELRAQLRDWARDNTRLDGVALDAAQAEVGVNYGENIMPLYVRAENPFDYQSLDQVEAVLRKVFGEGERKYDPVAEKTLNRHELRQQMLRGDWATIESQIVQKAIKDLGHDSFYVSEDGQKNLAVYHPNQIKSATGNDGTYSRENNDIRYRSAPRAATAGEMEKTLQSYPAKLRPLARKTTRMVRGQYKSLLSKIMFTRDLLEQAAKVGLKSAKDYQDLHNKLAADVGSHERLIAEVVDDYNRLPDNLKGKGVGTVNDFLYVSTRAGKWGYQPDFLKDKNGARVKVEIDDSIADQYRRLGKEGQAFVDRVFRIGYESLQAKKDAVMNHTRSEYDMLIKAAEADGDAALADELRDEKRKTLEQFGSLMRLSGNIPYAPLKRFGKYAVVGVSKEYQEADEATRKKLERDENHYSVDFVETQSAAEDLEEKLKTEGGFADAYYSERAEDVENQMYGGSKTIQAFQRLRVQIKNHYDGLSEKATTPEDRAKAKELEKVSIRMRNMVTDLYLHALSENSARQAERRRKNVAGDIDMIRSFETQGKADGNFIGWLKHSADMLESLGRMRRESRDGRTTEARLPKSQFFNEIMRRHMQAMEYEPRPLAEWLARTTSKWYLAFSPSYYIQNATQPLMISLPVMAGKHGYVASASALGKAYGDIAALWPKTDNLLTRADFRALLDNDKLSDGERKLLSDLIDSQQLDIGMATEIGSFRIEGDNVVSRNWQKVDNALRHLQTRMEAINRASTALAAYRLETAAKGDGLAYASRIINETHGDYSAWNAPRAFNTGAGKVALQFRKFQLIQLSLMAKLLSGSLAKGDTKEARTERAVARKALAYVIGQALVVGGAKALPSVAAIGWIFSKAFGDTGDEPPEYILRQWIGDKDIADVILDGPLAKLTGFNMSAFGGMGNMLAVLPFTDVSLDRRGVTETGFALMTGPAGGLALRFADAYTFMSNGDPVRAIENTLPKGFSSVIKAAREGTQGIRQRDGDMQVDPEEINVLESAWTGLGFQTQDAVRRRHEQQTSYEIETGLEKRVTRIKTAYTEAIRDGDRDAAREALDDWQELQAKRRELGFKPQPLSALLKAPAEQRKRESQRVGTLQYQKGDRAFNEKVANY